METDKPTTSDERPNWREFLWSGLAIVLLLGSISGQSYAADGLTLADTTIRISPGMSAAVRHDVVIKGDHVAGCDKGKELTAKDLFVDGPASLSVGWGNIRAAGEAENTRLWLADANISNLPPSVSLKRRVLLMCGGTSNTFDYTLTNQPEGTFSLVIKPAVPKLDLTDTHQTSLMASVGDIEATNVKLAQSTLQDENTLNVLGLQDLQLCRKDTAACTAAPFSLPRRTSGQPLTLSVSDDFARPGIFKGTIMISEDQKTDPESFELTVYSSRLSWKIYGGICIFIGVALWWFVSVYARQRAARTQALIPLAELTKSIDRLLAELNPIEQQTNVSMSEIQGRLETINDQLDPTCQELSNLLPGANFSLGDAGGDAAGYKTYLSARSNQIAAISLVLKQGFPGVLANKQKAISTHKEGALLTAVEALIDIASTSNTPDDASTKVQQTIRTLLAALQPAGVEQDAGLAFQALTVGSSTTPSTAELNVSLRRMNISVWIIWAVITLVAGVAAVILTNQGFGTPMDYVKCFFWGLSIQAGGQQLQQLSPTAVATDFKISLPK